METSLPPPWATAGTEPFAKRRKPTTKQIKRAVQVLFDFAQCPTTEPLTIRQDTKSISLTWDREIGKVELQ